MVILIEARKPDAVRRKCIGGNEQRFLEFDVCGELQSGLFAAAQRRAWGHRLLFRLVVDYELIDIFK